MSFMGRKSGPVLGGGIFGNQCHSGTTAGKDIKPMQKRRAACRQKGQAFKTDDLVIELNLWEQPGGA